MTTEMSAGASMPSPDLPQNEAALAAAQRLLEEPYRHVVVRGV
jgi:hypothetical protein